MGMLRQIKRSVKRAVGLKEKCAVILMYHRVADVASSPYHGIVSIDHFEQQMQYLHDQYCAMPLTALADAVKKKTIPRKSVIITFDDGYSDNYHVAYPILKKHQIPATIFVTSQYPGSRKEYWWDELERLLILPDELPESIPLIFGDQPIHLNFKRFDKEQRIILLRGIHGFLKSCRPADRDTLLAALRTVTGVEENGREGYLPMTRDEVITLSQSGLVDIGAHTMSHPALSAISREEQREEIVGSIQAIEELIGKPVRTFAYPFGSAHDINKASIEIIRSTGVQAAVTTTPGVVWANNSDLAALPRLWVGDWDKETFRKNIEPYFYGIG